MALRLGITPCLAIMCAIACSITFANDAAIEHEPRRQILICVSAKASPAIRAAADDFVKNGSAPLIKALIATQGAGNPIILDSEKVLKNSNLAAFNHLIIIGLKSNDPLLEKGWDHYASVDETARSFYAQGWGYLKGDVGYIESDRNPFLHSNTIKSAPFETVIVKITGTTEAGVLAALNEFRGSGLLNGFVPAGKWERPRTTILDLDPVLEAPGIKLPAQVTLKAAAPLAGWMQVPANEYRAILEDGGTEPVRMWRFKYLNPGALNHAGAAGWFAGINRMSYGNSFDVIEFKSSTDAQKCTAEICRKGWKKIELTDGHGAWQNDLGTDELWAKPPGREIVFPVQKFIILSSLPNDCLTPSTFLKQ